VQPGPRPSSIGGRDAISYNRPMLKAGWIYAMLPLVAVTMAGAAQPSRDWAGLRRFFRQQVADAGIVGASLVVVRQGAVQAEEYAGYRDEAARRPVDRDTIYHWASITKTFTGIAIMQLRDRGRLTLDDPVVKFVPEVGQIHNRFGDASQITIRRLMSHSAGLRASTWPWGGGQPWHPFEPTAWTQLTAMFPYTEVLFEPGTQYRYSNPGVILLGRIIETLSGDDYEMYVTKNILMPLGMHHSFFDRAPYHLRDRRSHSYARTDAGLAEMPFDFDTGITVSNGGLNAPLTDMANYLNFLIGGAGRPDYDGVLSRASLEEMWRPVIRAADGEGGSGQDVHAGLSFFIERYRGVELIGHSGNQNGFLSHLYLHRPSRSAYVVAFNTDAASASRNRPRITRDVDEALRDRLLEELAVQP
jgi:CubicO group peptidase (beta-lactamase class C family)